MGYKDKPSGQESPADGIVNQQPPLQGEPTQPADKRPEPAAGKVTRRLDVGGLVAGMFRDSGYLLPTLPIALVTGVLVICGVAIGAGLVVLWIGLGLLAVTLTMARWFAEFDLLRLAATGRDLRAARALIPPRPPVTRVAWARPILSPIRNPWRWREAAYVALLIPVGTLTWSVALTVWALVLGGLGSPIWEPISEQAAIRDGVVHSGLGDLMGLVSVPNWLVDMAVGALALLAMPFILRPLVDFHAVLARWLLTPGQAPLAGRVAQLERARERASAAEAQSLRRIERDIHDGPQQQLIRLSMDLSAAQRRLGSGDAAAADSLLAEARGRLDQAIGDLRAITRGIAPPILQDRGLVAALSAVAAGLALPVRVTVTPPDAPRLPEAQESALYFCACELLANVARHSGAGAAGVKLVAPPGADYAELTVHDDGHGGAAVMPGHGLAGLHDRMEALDGGIDVASSRDGTVVAVRVPLANSRR
ncbi:MAG: sensor domain-containing protein [Bifidobacteriaceae bacterium]|jgi:signal transduction histidine kinase|nr:sensor domain-containing protein [Bifidobacteriaceae bacterium]